MNESQPRHVKSAKLRGILEQIADGICAAQDKVMVSLSGSTFHIHLEGGTINISINQNAEGGVR